MQVEEEEEEEEEEEKEEEERCRSGQMACEFVSSLPPPFSLPT